MSSERSDIAYLHDMLEAIQQVQSYVQGYDYEAFLQDRKTRDAVIRNLEVIGEAVRKLSRSLRARHPQVEWRAIAGFRDRLIHDYFGINYETVWQIIQDKLPSLQAELQKIIQAEGETHGV